MLYKLKQACININNNYNKSKVLYSISSFDKINNKHHQEEMCHYNKLKDDIINREGVNFPAGNRDIDRLEVNDDGLISVNGLETNAIVNEEKHNQNKSNQRVKC